MFIDPGLIEDEIKTAVSDVVDPIPVDLYPDNPKNYFDNVLDSSIGVILIAMVGGESVQSHEAESDFSARCELSLVIPNLRPTDSHKGVYGSVVAIIEDLEAKRIVISNEPFTLNVDQWAYTRKTEEFWEYKVSVSVNPTFALAAIASSF
jgi:hypothetical protein